MTCKICQKGNISRSHKKVTCNHCYREVCVNCGKPILLAQSMRKTARGLMHLGVCPRLRTDIPLEMQWEQLGLPITQ